jgi:hypothetical protein
VIEAAELLAMQKLVRKVPVGDHVFEYATNLGASHAPQSPGSIGLRARNG